MLALTESKRYKSLLTVALDAPFDASATTLASTNHDSNAVEEHELRVPTDDLISKHFACSLLDERL